MKIQKMRYGTKIIQKFYRAVLMFRTFKFMKKCAKILQKDIRMFLGKVKLKKKKILGRKINLFMKRCLKKCRLSVEPGMAAK